LILLHEPDSRGLRRGRRVFLQSNAPCRLLYSSRSREETVFADELDHLAGSGGTLEVVYTLTRFQPPGWTGYARRIDREMLAEVAPSSDQMPLTFVCGPTPLVESVATALVGLGHDAGRVKTERFGPTGG
jgi:ferredoxin-NADP reductase